jgi:hypothetical protein
MSSTCQCQLQAELQDQEVETQFSSHRFIEECTVAQKLTKGADVPPPLVHIAQLGRIVVESQMIGLLDQLTCGSAQLLHVHDGASSFFQYNVFFLLQ